VWESRSIVIDASEQVHFPTVESWRGENEIMK
jgi:hypothetical protein